MATKHKKKRKKPAEPSVYFNPAVKTPASAKKTAKKTATVKAAAKKTATVKNTAKKTAPVKNTAKKTAPVKNTAKKTATVKAAAKTPVTQSQVQVNAPTAAPKLLWQKVLKIAAIVLLSLLLTVNLLTITLSKLGLRRTLNYLPGAFVTIETGSMEPKLSAGDLIFVYRSSFEKLEVGDVITYVDEDNGEYITHGIIKIENDAMITIGLQNEKADSPVGEEYYCAKMLFAIPGAAALYELMQETYVTVLLIVLILALCYGVPAYEALYSLIEARKKASEAREKPAGNEAPQTGETAKIGACRVLASLALVSFVLTVPFFSSAKYRADVGGIVMSTAGEVGFNSNSLSDNGKDYYIQGWTGITYPLTLNINNWQNSLKYNEDEDITYTVTLEKILTEDVYEEAGSYEAEKTYFVKSGDTYIPYEGDGTESPLPQLYVLIPGCNDEYVLGIDGHYREAEYQNDDRTTYYKAVYTEFVHEEGEDDIPSELFAAQDGSYVPAEYEEGGTFYTRSYEQITGTEDPMPQVYVQGAGTYGPFTLKKGKVRTDNLKVVLSTDRGVDSDGQPVAMNQGERVCFRVTAKTVEGSTYDYELSGTFTLEVGSATDFIGAVTCTQPTGGSTADCTLETNRVDGVSFKKVVFSWQADELQLNTLINPVWDFLEKDPTCYDVQDGVATFTLQKMEAPAYFHLNFFKLQNVKMSAEVTYDEIHDFYSVVFVTEPSD